ncbi:tRNA uracil 4-sulfurtransferase ThiI [Victivallis sp. Marseille-Q1083]|uniref:tRNA uracil 4-sulfurtransferase ThiI n=1 Tax=Victivallis sp. Marseille-Q1083 TaxID=2717288 RepID=UPI00158B9681|nr:tRNA uracil 4-sulfurtransferase ThiI [Victivallis sp. Marseille-Q1083]
MYNAIICRYHEIAIKGNNRGMFERRLVDNLYYLLRELSEIRIARIRGRVWIEHKDHSAFSPEELAFCRRQLPRAFGLESASPAIKTAPVMAELTAALRTAAPAVFQPVLAEKSPVEFRVRARRSDKTFPLRSQQIEIELATVIGDLFGADNLRLNLDDAELTVGCEVRDEFAILFFESWKGPGGLPVGSNDRVLALLSGGIDSPVACYLTMKRGSNVDFLAFHSAPYTPPETTDKIRRIAGYLNGFQQSGRLYLCNIAELQKAIRDNCNPRLRTVLYRRMMFRIGERIARRTRCLALLTGESLGQVASQTLVNMGTIGAATSLLVLRPLVGLDKLDSVRYAEAIGTFELSRQQVPDSCTVFAPDSPATAVPVDKALAEEAKLGDYPALLDKIVDAAECVVPD